MCTAPTLLIRPDLWKWRKKRGKRGQYWFFRAEDERQYICYCATHKTGYQYIGITCKGLEHRKSQHIRAAMQGKGGLFQYALKELGADQFDWKIEGEGSKEEMQRLESNLIDERCTHYPHGFNSMHGVDISRLDFEKEMKRLD